MNHATGKFIAVVLTAGLLGLPAGLSAKQRQGATLVVTKLDGAQVSGELIAVRPDSLLLLSDSRDAVHPPGRGPDRPDRPEIEGRALRRSSEGPSGWPAWDFWCQSAGPDVEYGTEKTLLGGGVGVLAGVIAGFVKGVDPVFAVAGRPQAEIARYWVKLSAHSREGRIKEPPRRRGPSPYLGLRCGFRI